MKNILIIGGDSFIASKFYETHKNDFNISVISRIDSGKVSELIVEDLFSIDSSCFSCIDTVINFAAIVHRPDIKEKSIYDRINFELPLSLAHKAKEKGVKHFIQLSTIAVYGNVDFISSSSPENPVNFYGESKLKADHGLEKMQDSDFIVSSIRPPMVYGGGLAPGNMLKLINASLKGIPMPFGGVNNKRDFINVANLVEALNTVVLNTISGVVIPTDKQSISTEEIVKLVGTNTNKKVRVISIPKFCLRIASKLFSTIYNKVYGSLLVECNLCDQYYKPKFKIENGIKDMVDAIQKQ